MDDGGSGADTIVLNAHGNSDFIGSTRSRSLRLSGFYNKVKVPNHRCPATSNIMNIIRTA